MAQYLILLYDNEAAWAAATPERRAQELTNHARFQQQLAEMGAKNLGGNALLPSTMATSVRGDVVTDGPFAETKEALGGYYLIEAADLDDAIAIARQIPVVAGGVEVRPIMVFD